MLTFYFRNQNGFTTKTVLWTMVAVVVLLFVLLVVFRPEVANPEKELSSPQEQGQVLRQSAQSILAQFPEGFPALSDIQNADSYKYIPADSIQQQSTLEYVSSKSFAENKQIFLEYLKQAGFEITNQVDEADFAFFYASKDNNDLSITIVEADGQVKISASYLKR